MSSSGSRQLKKISGAAFLAALFIFFSSLTQASAEGDLSKSADPREHKSGVLNYENVILDQKKTRRLFESPDIQGADPGLVNQANAPLSSIMQVRLRNTYIPRFMDTDGRGNIFSVDLTMPLPAYRLLPIKHLTVLSAPVAVTVPGGRTAFGDLRFTDLAMLYESRQFVFGVGPAFVFPTATDRRAGQGKWQLGPAAGGAVMSKKWMAGVLVQNPMSFAGDEDRFYANSMLLQPFVTYQLGKGWFVRSQPQMIFDWRTEAKIFPVDLGVGRTFKMGSRDVNCFVQPFWNFATEGHPPQYGVNAGFSFLFPDFWKKFSKAHLRV